MINSYVISKVTKTNNQIEYTNAKVSGKRFGWWYLPFLWLWAVRWHNFHWSDWAVLQWGRRWVSFNSLEHGALWDADLLMHHRVLPIWNTHTRPESWCRKVLINLERAEECNLKQRFALLSSTLLRTFLAALLDGRLGTWLICCSLWVRRMETLWKLERR